MLGSQVPDLTSILNRRGAMMPLAGGNMNSLRNLNPMMLASLDRAGLVDIRATMYALFEESLRITLHKIAESSASRQTDS